MDFSDSTYIRFAVWKIYAIWDLVGWAKKTTWVIVAVIFQAAGKQCCMGLKESIITRFLTHTGLEMGEAFLFNPRRLQREGEKKLVEWEAQRRGGAGREAYFYKLAIVCTCLQYRVKGRERRWSDGKSVPWFIHSRKMYGVPSASSNVLGTVLQLEKTTLKKTNKCATFVEFMF